MPFYISHSINSNTTFVIPLLNQSYFFINSPCYRLSYHSFKFFTGQVVFAENEWQNCRFNSLSFTYHLFTGIAYPLALFVFCVAVSLM